SDNIEGSYADAGSLRGAAGIGKPWLFVDRGDREMAWDDHCNSLHTRWILRNHGITLGRPPPREVIDPVSEQAMREAARQALPGPRVCRPHPCPRPTSSRPPQPSVSSSRALAG